MNVNNFLCKHCRVNLKGKVTVGSVVSKFYEIAILPVVIIASLVIFTTGVFLLYRDWNILWDNMNREPTTWLIMFEFIILFVIIVLLIILILKTINYISNIDVADCNYELKKELK